MLPLTTAWAFTIWKSRGQTFFGKVVLNLGEHEKEHGLSYVAFSCATRFSDIGLKDGITETCLILKIRNQAKCRGTFSMKEILTDSMNKQKHGWPHTMNKLSSNLSFYFKFHFNFLFILRAIWIALKKILLVIFTCTSDCSSLLYELVF